MYPMRKAPAIPRTIPTTKRRWSFLGDGSRGLEVAVAVGAANEVELPAGYGDMLGAAPSTKPTPLNERSGVQEDKKMKECRGTQQATKLSD